MFVVVVVAVAWLTWATYGSDEGIFGCAQFEYATWLCSFFWPQIQTPINRSSSCWPDGQPASRPLRANVLNESSFRSFGFPSRKMFHCSRKNGLLLGAFFSLCFGANLINTLAQPPFGAQVKQLRNIPLGSCRLASQIFEPETIIRLDSRRWWPLWSRRNSHSHDCWPSGNYN